uniref:Uncharacterized protein n=1 Tax=Anopheles merus TaxID=30066 RepID=A0A182VD58_ANOME
MQCFFRQRLHWTALADAGSAGKLLELVLLLLGRRRRRRRRLLLVGVERFRRLLVDIGQGVAVRGSGPHGRWRHTAQLLVLQQRGNVLTQQRVGGRARVGGDGGRRRRHGLVATDGMLRRWSTASPTVSQQMRHGHVR